MSQPRHSLPEALRLLLAESAPPTADGHPDSDHLIAYTERQLDEPERLRLQRHLALCPECARAVLDLENFPDVDLHGEASVLSDEEEAADWQALEKRLGVRPASSGTPVPSRPSPRLRRLPLRRMELAAAALLIVTAGLVLWAARLHHRVEELTRELSRPQSSVFVSDLMPARTLRSEEILSLPSGTRHLVLILNMDDLRSFSAYGVEILDREGVVTWQDMGIRRDPAGSFSVSLPRPAIPSGPCHIRLSGLDGSRKIPLATYAFQVTFEPPG
jgi:hypothetical protein